MATITLSKQSPNLATYYASSISVDSYGDTYPASINVPVWNNGRKTFFAYYAIMSGSKVPVVSSHGITFALYGMSENVSATENWVTDAPAAVIYTGSTSVAEIVYDGGVWYYDYNERIPFDSTSQITIKREGFRFLGAFAENNTTSEKYINADGTPTAAFLALSITDDMKIYAQWESASVKITISSSSGEYESKTFYQSIVADESGAYGYYTESDCAPDSRIYGIQVPTRELYAWGGLRASSSTSGALWANPDGTFTDAFLARTAKAVTAYGNFWTQVSYKITVNANGGEASVSTYYTSKADGYVFEHWLVDEDPLDTLPIPVRIGYRFLGYFSSSTTGSGTKYVDADGTIQSALNTRKTSTTIYAQWRKASATVTLDAAGGESGTSEIYYDGTGGAFFDASSATVTSVALPIYEGNAFLGYYTEAGDEVISANGAISAGFAPTSNMRISAKWTIGKSVITVDAGGGSGGTSVFYRDIIRGGFFADSALTIPLSSLALPTLRLFDFAGMFTESVGGMRAVTASGSFLPDFLPSDENVTIYAQYNRRCYEVTIDAVEGIERSAFYHAPNSTAFYADDMLGEEVANVGVPVRLGYTFGGFFYNNEKIIATDGEILPAAAIGIDYAASAEWTANKYTLSFDAAGGTVETQSKTVTQGAAIGFLPTASFAGKKFIGWKIDTSIVSKNTTWIYGADKVAIAQYETSFGTVEDYFGLASDALVPESSESGDNAHHICAYNMTSESPATETTESVWRNPRTTYKVVGNVSLNVMLGKAFEAEWNALDVPVTGWMIASVEVHTAIGEVPTVTISGVANEGADSVNTGIRATCNISPRHRPQDILSSINARNKGGELQECTVKFLCDPVVVAENGAPCASDVTHGRVEVDIKTHAYDNESAPQPATGFVRTGIPLSRSGVGYKVWSARFRKEI